MEKMYPGKFLMKMVWQVRYGKVIVCNKCLGKVQEE